MGESNKQRRVRRARWKLINRDADKIRQIRQLQARLNTYPVNPFTGQVETHEHKGEN